MGEGNLKRHRPIPFPLLHTQCEGHSKALLTHAIHILSALTAPQINYELSKTDNIYNKTKYLKEHSTGLHVNKGLKD